MIKPFKITKTVVEPEGNLGVHFVSTKSIVSEDLFGAAVTVKAYLSVAPDADVDLEIFNYLKDEWL